MIQSAVTISLVPEARGGPFIFWDDLAGGCRKAAELGFDAVEIFAPGPDVLPERETRALLERHGLSLAAVGTGAGWVKHQLTLSSPDPSVRRRATEFVRSMIDAAGVFGAPAIVGSMQGRWGNPVSRDDAMSMLTDAFAELEEIARGYRVPLLYEPLNRYETNLCNSVAQGASWVRAVRLENTKILADLFHMNIEEADAAGAIRAAGDHVGHIHLADSNRRAAGLGHTPFAPIAEALRAISYSGYVSAEALPDPDSETAARLTIEAFRKYFR